MPSLSVVGIALLIPFVVVIGNGFVRHCLRQPQSAATDLILAMVVFDATVSLQAQDFAPFVRWSWVGHNLPVIYMILLIANMFIWFGAALKLEPGLVTEFDFKKGHYIRSPGRLLFYSYMIFVVVLLTNILPFTSSA